MSLPLPSALLLPLPVPLPPPLSLPLASAQFVLHRGVPRLRPGLVVHGAPRKSHSKSRLVPPPLPTTPEEFFLWDRVLVRLPVRRHNSGGRWER